MKPFVLKKTLFEECHLHNMIDIFAIIALSGITMSLSTSLKAETSPSTSKHFKAAIEAKYTVAFKQYMSGRMHRTNERVIADKRKHAKDS